MSPSVTHFAELPEGRIAFDDTGGDGPLVLCVPGMGDLRSQYRALAPRLAHAGYRVLTMDLRGFGESDATFHSYTPDDVADDMAAVLETRAGALPAIVIAGSMAAASSIRLASVFPTTVYAIVMLGPVPRDHPAGKLQSVAYHAIVKSGFAGSWGASAWAAYYRKLFPTNPPEDLTSHLDALKTNLMRHGRLHALRNFILASKDGCAAHASQLHVPVLAVEGSLDPDVPDPQAELDWLAEQVGAETVLMDGIGHYPHLEAPDETAQHVLGFLGGVERPAPPRMSERDETDSRLT